jgi:hypothetical protein
VSWGLLQAAPAAHRGFLTRARGVPIEALYEHACRQGRRLVLSGPRPPPCCLVSCADHPCGSSAERSCAAARAYLPSL